VAVLETAVGVGGPASIFDTHAKIVIAGMDFIGRARASFQPRTNYGTWYISSSGQPTWEEPYVYVGPNQVAVFSPHEAYVVRGTVYFIDGYGTVFRLGVDGIQTVVTKFPIGLNQQEVSFAVSPDGCQLVATVLTLPPAPQLRAGQQSPPPLSGKWTLQTMSAQAGSPAQLLHTWSGTDYPNSKSKAAFENLVVVGWDSIGPIAAIHSGVGVAPDSLSVPIRNPDFFGAAIVHVSPDGTPGAPIALGGTRGCTPLQVSPAGDVTCYSPTGGAMVLSVVSTNGDVKRAPFDHPYFPEGIYQFSSPTVVVGPSGLIAVGGQKPAASSVQTPGEWRGPNGAGSLPANFIPEGWIDQLTIFGLLGDGGTDEAALVRLGPAQKVERLGFSGDFVGMLGG
jgi:hypothetical protein